MNRTFPEWCHNLTLFRETGTLVLREERPQIFLFQQPWILVSVWVECLIVHCSVLLAWNTTTTTMLLCDGGEREQIRNVVHAWLWQQDKHLNWGPPLCCSHSFCWVPSRVSACTVDLRAHGSVHVEQRMEIICCLPCYARQTLLTGYWALVGLHQANQGTLDPGPD